MPARTASGRSGQAATTEARSVGKWWAGGPEGKCKPLKSLDLRRSSRGIIIRVSGVRGSPPLFPSVIDGDRPEAASGPPLLKCGVEPSELDADVRRGEP